MAGRCKTVADACFPAYKKRRRRCAADPPRPSPSRIPHLQPVSGRPTQAEVQALRDKCEELADDVRALARLMNEGSNPFRGIVTTATETVSRMPFTPDELKAIQEACADDDFIRPVIITGMCTAMRRGDGCCLKWSDVDLKERFISVKTFKTGEKVDIPIFPLLQEELQRAKEAGPASDHCFPQAAEMYLRSADGISIRVKAVLAREFDRIESAGRK